MESDQYLGAGEHEPAIQSSTIVGLMVGNDHDEQAQSLDESRPQIDLEPVSLRHGCHAHGGPRERPGGTEKIRSDLKKYNASWSIGRPWVSD